MFTIRRFQCWALVGLVLQAAGAALCVAQAGEPGIVELGSGVPKAAAIQQGLFPDDECEQLKANGYKCMGFKPPVRFSLPAASFKLGSADLPDGLKRQLDAFAQVLRGKSGASRAVRIEGHADALGSEDVNNDLSRKRAEAARDYLVAKGVAPELLKPVGVGSKALLDPAQPLSARNRRVVLGRDQMPASSPGQ